jgi:hypothetical protein
VTVSSHRLVPRDQTTATAATAFTAGPASKRRRVSASSSDSGLDEAAAGSAVGGGGKYPRLQLNEEERRMAIKEGMTFPKYYPLSR